MRLSRRLAWTAPLLAAAACAPTADPATTAVAPQPQAGARTADAIDQIGQASRDVRPSRIDAGSSASAKVSQLPADRTALTGSAPEADLASAGIAPARRQDLYREVAVAWEAIRARGAQPTPELIAQAVGPETLARFLAAFPDARNLFDTQKVDMPPPEQPPAPPPDAGGSGK